MSLMTKGAGKAISAGGGPAWTPASASAGAWYDVSDLSTLFQDGAGTVPVTADGQTVKRINDKSGNGHHLTTAADIGWVYHANAGKPYLQMAGSSELFANAAATTFADVSGQLSLGIAATVADITANHQLVTGTSVYGSLIGNAFANVQANAWTAAGSQIGVDNGPTITQGAGVALTQITTTTTVEAFLNGTGDGATSLTGTPGQPSDNLHIGFGCSGHFAALALFPSALNSTDHANLVTWLLARF